MERALARQLWIDVTNRAGLLRTLATKSNAPFAGVPDKIPEQFVTGVAG